MKKFKKWLCLILVIMSLFGMCVTFDYAEQVETYSYDIECAPEVSQIKRELIQTNDLNELQTLKNECLKRKEQSHLMAEGARGLGYQEDNPIIILAKKEWEVANQQQFYYEEMYNANLPKIDYEAKMKEYPEATTIWLGLKNAGYNDYVCAGILGNIIAECGGGNYTLKLQPYVTNSTGHYGICQWSSKYYPQVQGADLGTQINFLINTLPKEMDTYGRLYGKQFGCYFYYSNFIELESEQSAAEAFAKCYERCGNQSTTKRKDNATKALAYFTN